MKSLCDKCDTNEAVMELGDRPLCLDCGYVRVVVAKFFKSNPDVSVGLTQEIFERQIEEEFSKLNYGMRLISR